MSELTDELLARQLLANGQARIVREAAGCSRAALARAVGVAESAVVRWELGDRSPRGANVARYGAVLRELAEHAQAQAALRVPS